MLVDKRRANLSASICDEFDLIYCKLTDTQASAPAGWPRWFRFHLTALGSAVDIPAPAGGVRLAPANSTPCSLVQVATVTSAMKLENEQQFQIAKKLQELTGAAPGRSLLASA